MHKNSQIALYTTIKSIEVFAKLANDKLPPALLQEIIDLDRLETTIDQAQSLLQVKPAEVSNKTSAYLQSIFDVFNPKNQNYYNLEALTPQSIFPQKDYKQSNIQTLWQDFKKQLESLKKNDAQINLWLDALDSLLLCYTQNIALPGYQDISLYDYYKILGALSIALYENTEEFLFIQGNMHGIQDFIFATGGSTSKYAAKLLRGRSFYVSLLIECAALKVLETFDLPPTSQIINAAGKFLIIAPKVENYAIKIKDIQEKNLDSWFLEQSFGLSGIDLVYKQVTPEKFKDFNTLKKLLFRDLEKKKLQHFNLLNTNTPAVFEKFGEKFDPGKGTCPITGHLLAEKSINKEEDKITVSNLAYDQIKIGEYLTQYKHLMLSNKKSNKNSELSLGIFGYIISFGKKDEALNNNSLRYFEFDISDENNLNLWKGHAKRFINGYIPKFTTKEQLKNPKYDKIKQDQKVTTVPNPKPLDYITTEDKKLINKDTWQGLEALHILKGDVDNLGSLFENENLSLSKMSMLSRQMNSFFTIYLPYLCARKFTNTYTVFAGGDDFFLIGPWCNTLKLAKTIQEAFKDYTSGDSVHFSVGLALHKGSHSIRYLSHLAEESLFQAKHYKGKNAVTCYGETVSWNIFHELIEQLEKIILLREKYTKNFLSTSYIYGLLKLCDMAASDKPQDKIWCSYLSYRTYRLVEDYFSNSDLDKKKKTDLVSEIITPFAKGILEYKTAFKIVLYTYLYKYREEKA